MVFVYLFIIACLVLAIIEWITNPQNIVLCLVGISVILAFSVLASWYFVKKMCIIEIRDEKIIFKFLFHRYVIPFSQIQGIERKTGRNKNDVYFALIVEGYDSNKVFYPFEFECNRKTQEIAQKLQEMIQKRWVDMQLSKSDDEE